MLRVSPRPALGRCRRRAAGAQALNRQLDLLRVETGGQRDAARRRRLVQADDLAAVIALEMGVGVSAFGFIACRVETPYPVVTGDLVSQVMGGQPFQHPVDRHAVHPRAAIDAPFNLMVAQRATGCQKDGQHFDALPSHARAGALHQIFGTIVKRRRHGRH